MPNRLKNVIYTIVLLTVLFSVYTYRSGQQPEGFALTGTTMGPIQYSVKYFDEEGRNFKPQIDSLLDVFNQSLNTYRPESEITRFNNDSLFIFDLPYFPEAVKRGLELNKITEGAFDPSIGPLIDAWGFGSGDLMELDSSKVDSLRQIIGMDKLVLEQNLVRKINPVIQLSFSASAKGYGVDVVMEYLMTKGIKNAFVEIGGEVRAMGKQLMKDGLWEVGILHPDSKEDSVFAIAQLPLSGRAMATSGNYFNYRIIDGKKFGHTIDPRTGYPIVHNLLSASVIADDCQTADALATAFMVMGVEKSMEFLNRYPEYDAFLVYSVNGQLATYATNGIAEQIKILNP